jgi:hypothetical protein
VLTTIRVDFFIHHNSYLHHYLLLLAFSSFPFSPLQFPCSSFFATYLCTLLYIPHSFRFSQITGTSPFREDFSPELSVLSRDGEPEMDMKLTEEFIGRLLVTTENPSSLTVTV